MSVFWGTFLTNMTFLVCKNKNFWLSNSPEMQVFVAFMLPNSNSYNLKLHVDHAFVDNRLSPNVLDGKYHEKGKTLYAYLIFFLIY